MPDEPKMDEHIKALFEQVQDFCESDLFLTPECTRRIKVAFDMEDRVMKACGAGSGRLLFNYQMAQMNVIELACQHYFSQGYRMGRKDKAE